MFVQCHRTSSKSRSGAIKSKVNFTVWACPNFSTATVEPYNTVLCLHSLLEHTDITMMYDNEATHGKLSKLQSGKRAQTL